LGAIVITVIYLLGLTASLAGTSIDDGLLSLPRVVMVIAWIGWIGVAVRDSVIEHQRAMSRVRRPDR
jgi:hypothetical protein